jgi:restriction system protein
MAVPDFQSMLVPFLKVISDGREHTTKEIIEALANHFDLSKEDRE